MSRDASIRLRKTLLPVMKADAALTALVPAASIYQAQPPATPPWPFIRYGQATATPLGASCLGGCVVSFTVHGFAHGPGDDAAAAIGDAILAAVAGNGDEGKSYTLTGSPAATAHVRWIGTQMLHDSDEADAWHAAVQFEAVVAL